MAEQLTFPLADGGSTPTPPLQIQVREISSAEAKTVVTRYHYSAKMPCGKMICFGYFVGGRFVVRRRGLRPRRE